MKTSCCQSFAQLFLSCFLSRLGSAVITGTIWVLIVYKQIIVDHGLAQTMSIIMQVALRPELQPLGFEPGHRAQWNRHAFAFGLLLFTFHFFCQSLGYNLLVVFSHFSQRRWLLFRWAVASPKSHL